MQQPSYFTFTRVLSSTTTLTQSDRPYFVTEKLDYFSVLAALEQTFYLVTAIALRKWRRVDTFKLVLRSLLLLLYVLFVTYMLAIKFDYGLHVKVCAFWVVASAFVTFATLFTPDRKVFAPMAAALISVASSAPLELFDFKPIWNVMRIGNL